MHENKSSTYRKRTLKSLPEEKIRSYFTDFILGLDYCFFFFHLFFLIDFFLLLIFIHI